LQLVQILFKREKIIFFARVESPGNYEAAAISWDEISERCQVGVADDKLLTKSECINKQVKMLRMLWRPGG